ncbi:hypothetical protein BDA96_01G186500 [Sorghum bicolor]|uniref:Cytokinin riboside 5'-monophosphate phosphoribohydrolase n=2 Tax=Sorghum bicolor TaxID=4558 RepID=A0A921V0J7_SORBI|nr:uncharacterized protein LOC8064540 [Sorghum bicolor]EER93868.1 hypothetical protein SORBI_3001G178000 [Sorghum bicolor]KAG0548666.1 hypothetical protein BDA96_01G186500 [Sorghum bicolor]|eukprot:XP_002466870.1 uncharacterized protein LOC8064540 [Sorghum bicolor]
MSMEAAAASSVGAEFGPALGFRNIHRRTLPYCWRPRSPRPASLSLCGGWGARPRGAIAAASGDQRRRQLGELEAEAEAGSALGPTRSSPREVREEMARCFDLVRRLGRGAVYLGSSRVPPTHPHFLQTTELAREIARLLDCTTWTGAGPGLMDAAIQGALEAGKPVGGLKIAKEAGEWTSSGFHPYLPPETYLTCRFFSARKHGLVDAAVRSSPTDRTAVVALPGGVGTLDELFEIMALIQLERIGSALPVPFLLLNYDSYYSKLLDFLNDCQEWGTVAPGEVESLWKVCDGNHEALEYLAEFYNVPADQRNYQISPQLKQHRTSYAAS